MAQTKSEKLLTYLATKTFFVPWVIPNPHKKEKCSTKEIADLIVVFDQIILIFLVKEIEFDTKNKGFDANSDWSIVDFTVRDITLFTKKDWNKVEFWKQQIKEKAIIRGNTLSWNQDKI